MLADSNTGILAPDYRGNHSRFRPAGSMLQAMQEPSAATPPPTAASFASLLAALSAPAPQPSPEWNEDGLADDIATLSYERALRTHARYRSTRDNVAGPGRRGSTASFPESASSRNRRERNPAFADRPRPVRPSTALEKNRKSQSITIRLNQEEGERLRERATEAGLTVSAYLRSCIFEAETLRAQVKEALVQLRSGSSTDEKKPPASAPSSTWRTRLFPRWTGSHRAARA